MTLTGGPLEKPLVTFQLLRNGEEYLDSVDLVNGKVTHEWLDLDATDLNGLAYIYTVEEITSVEDYVAHTSSDGLTVTNTYVSPKSDITAYKVWVDGPELRPDVTLQLLRDGLPYLDPVTLTNTDEYTWVELDENDSNGVSYIYTVDEINNPDNYIETKGEGGFVIINTYVSPLIDITTHKVWINGPELKPSITIQLYRNNEPHLAAITLDDGELEYTWTNLPKTDSYGNVYEYTVGEISVLDDYIASVSDDGLTITNTYKSPLIDIIGNKVWVGGLEKHPTIYLQLYRNGVKHLDAVEIADGVVSYTWMDLEMKDNSGVNYTYTIDEDVVPVGYVKTISVDGLTIINTYEEDEIIDILPPITPPPVPEEPVKQVVPNVIEKPVIKEVPKTVAIPKVEPSVAPPVTGVESQNVNTFILISIIALFAIYVGIILKKKNS